MGTQIDLRDDPSTIEKLAKNKQKPITPETAEKLARDLKAVKYVECSALTQVGEVLLFHKYRNHERQVSSHKKVKNFYCGDFDCFIKNVSVAHPFTFNQIMRRKRFKVLGKRLI